MFRSFAISVIVGLPLGRFLTAFQIWLLSFFDILIQDSEISRNLYFDGRGKISIISSQIMPNTIFRGNVVLQKIKSGHSVIFDGGKAEVSIRNSILSDFVYIKNNVHISDSFINAYCTFESGCSAPIFVDGSIIGPGCRIITSAHPWFLDPEAPYVSYSPIFIEASWLCAGVVVIPGVRIDAGSVIAAGAVVTKNVPVFSLVAGCPAKVKKNIPIREIKKNTNKTEIRSTGDIYERANIVGSPYIQNDYWSKKN